MFIKCIYSPIFKGSFESIAGASNSLGSFESAEIVGTGGGLCRIILDFQDTLNR